MVLSPTSLCMRLTRIRRNFLTPPTQRSPQPNTFQDGSTDAAVPSRSCWPRAFSEMPQAVIIEQTCLFRRARPARRPSRAQVALAPVSGGQVAAAIRGESFPHRRPAGAPSIRCGPDKRSIGLRPTPGHGSTHKSEIAQYIDGESDISIRFL